MRLNTSCGRIWQGSSTYSSRDEVVMAMDIVLKKLEERIEEMVAAFASSKEREKDLQVRIAELETQVGEFEVKVAEGAGAASRAEDLERQKNDLASRLERVVDVIDRALEKTDS